MLGFVSSVLAKISAWKNVLKMTHFLLSGTWKVNSVNQSICNVCVLVDLELSHLMLSLCVWQCWYLVTACCRYIHVDSSTWSHSGFYCHIWGLACKLRMARWVFIFCFSTASFWLITVQSSGQSSIWKYPYYWRLPYFLKTQCRISWEKTEC